VKTTIQRKAGKSFFVTFSSGIWQL